MIITGTTVTVGDGVAYELMMKSLKLQGQWVETKSKNKS